MIIRFGKLILATVTATVVLLMGCSQPPDTDECKSLLDWSRQLTDDSNSLTPEVVEAVRAGPTKRDRIKEIIKAEEAALGRVLKLLDQSKKHERRSELRDRAEAVASALIALSQKRIELHSTSLEGNLEPPPDDAEDAELARLERAGLEFDTLYDSECGKR